jgi:hypothetical protein
MALGDLGRTSDEAADLTQATALASGSVSSVSDNTVTTIVSLTASGTKYISKIVCSGQVYAKFTLVKNTTTFETRRGGPDRTIEFDFGGALKLDDTDVLDVKVEHFVTTETPTFESTIYGV